MQNRIKALNHDDLEISSFAGVIGQKYVKLLCVSIFIPPTLHLQLHSLEPTEPEVKGWKVSRQVAFHQPMVFHEM